MAQFSVYSTILATVFPIFFIFYLGAWSDFFGRKLLFKAYLIARCLGQLSLIINTYFLLAPKEYLLFGWIPNALVGKYIESDAKKQKNVLL